MTAHAFDSRAKIVIERGAIKGITPSGGRHFWLEYLDDSGADIIFVSETRAEAVAAARWLARGGVRIFDRTEGPR